MGRQSIAEKGRRMLEGRMGRRWALGIAAACAAGVTAGCAGEPPAGGDGGPVDGAGGADALVVDAGPDAAWSCDPEAMVDPNGVVDEEPGLGGCPAGMIPVDTFCVDRYEAALVLSDGTPWSPYFNPETRAV